jgi:hypothetical protein
VSTANPSIGVSLNGRTSAGQAQTEASWKGATANLTLSPLAGSPIYLKGFLWPAANGAVMAWYVIWDSVDTSGGTITLDQMLLESFDPTLLTGETVLADFGTGATPFVTGDFTTGQFAFYNPSLTNNVNVTVTATANSLSFTGQAGSSTATDGVGYALHPKTLFTTSASSGKKLVVVKVMAKTTSSDSAKIPDFIFAVNDVISDSPVTGGNYRSTFMIDRYFQSNVVQNPDADLAAIARPYYCIFESDPSKKYDFTIYAGVFFDDGTNGNVTVERVTALEYDLPSETVVLP